MQEVTRQKSFGIFIITVVLLVQFFYNLSANADENINKKYSANIDKWVLWTDSTQLRGANIYQRRVYPEIDGPEFLGYGTLGPPYTQEDFDQLAWMGANYVNISHPGLFTEDSPFILDQDVQDNLDSLLLMATRSNIFAVISFRTGPGRSEFTFHIEDVGDWFSASYLNDSVWQDQDAQDGWVSMWRYTAERYRDNPVVIGYDLMVEPNSNEVGSDYINDRLDIWDPDFFYSNYGGTLYDWNQLYPRITDSIRYVDSETPILIGGMGYSSVEWLPYLQLTGDSRTIYTIHQYEPFVYTHQDPPLFYTYPGVFDTDWDGIDDQFDLTWLENLISVVNTFKSSHNVPVAVNEFGIKRWELDAADFLGDEISLFEQNNMNHAVWLWECSWESYTEEVDDFNFRHGPDPQNHTDVLSSDLMDVIEGYWSKNTVHPSTCKLNTYYVNNGHPSASDSNPGTSDQPWLTIQHAANSVSPGDTVVVCSGTYSGVTFNVSGASDSLITFSGESSESVIVQGGFEFTKGVSYLYVSEFTIQDFSAWGVFVRGTNIHIRLSELNISGGECGVHLTWGYQAQDPIDGSVSNITLENSLISDCIYTAVDCTPGPCNRMIFRNLEITGAGIVGEDSWGSDGIAVERGDTITVENCYIHDNGGDGIDLNSRDFGGNSTGIVVRSNRLVRNHRTGIKLWGGGRIENNVLWGQGFTPVFIGAFPGTYSVINNTIAYNMWSADFGVRNYAFTAAYPDDETGISAEIDLTLVNNIFAFNSCDDLGGPTGLYLGEGVTFADEGYNLFWSRSDGEIQAEFIQGETWFTREQITNGTWASATGQGQGNITEDPLFVSGWPSADLHPLSASPAIDAGLAIDTILYDVEGNTRPSGTGYDIGAYECQSEDVLFNFSQAGWYMVSLSVVPADCSVSTLFPTAIGGTAFYWNTVAGSYDAVTEIDPEKAYWIAIPEATTATFNGTLLQSYTAHFSCPGWYMIGSVSDTVAFNNPDDLPDTSVLSPAFRYDTDLGVYVQEDTLVPRQGYWIAVTQECSLSVEKGSTCSILVSRTDWNEFSELFGSTPSPPQNIDTDVAESLEIPKNFSLRQNFPNPFNSGTVIAFDLPVESSVLIRIVNVSGQKVAVLADDKFRAGYHSIMWNGKDESGMQAGSGVYFVVMEAGGFWGIRKAVLIR